MGARLAILAALIAATALILIPRRAAPPAAPPLPIPETVAGVRELEELEGAFAADANNAQVVRSLAHAYARAIFERGPLAPRAESAIEASSNVWVVGNTAHVLHSLYNRTVELGSPDERAARLAERYFLRAKALHPGLAREAILPTLDLDAAARARREQEAKARGLQARFDEAAGKIQRLPVDAFPDLPPAVANVLRSRGCRIPQPFGVGSRNVIRGEFFAPGETGWAALCSTRGSSAILAFRNDSDTNPDAIARAEDRGYLEDMGNAISYSRAICAVGRDFILAHHRGGPAPPPISHQGIDDAFLGKASITWYFHDGKWLALPGAD